MIGIVFSEKQIFCCIKNYQFQKRWMVCLCTILAVAASFLLRCYNRFWGDLPLALSMMFLIFLLDAYSKKNKIFAQMADMAAYIGRHSFLIFALHTFYITIYGKDVIYRLRNPLLIYIVLLTVSLLTAVVVDKLKHISGFTVLLQEDIDIGILLTPSNSVPFDKRQSMKIKGAAICMLLFHHLFYSEYRLSYGGIVTHILSRDMLMSLASYARICVWLFAFVSAYGLAKSYLALGETVTIQNRLAFYKHHYISLMKPYWFVWISIFTATFLFSTQPAAYLKNNAGYIILDFLGWSDFFGLPSMNHTWWYMCLAQMILLFIPPFCEMIKKWGGVSLGFVFILMCFFNKEGIVSQFGGAYINYLFIVLLGVFTAESNWMEKISTIHATAAEIILMLVLICAGMYGNRVLSDIGIWHISKVLLSFSAFGICIFIYKYITAGPLEKVLAYLGKYSGNMFFIHTMLFDQAYRPKIVYWSHNVMISWMVCLALSLALSVAIEWLKRKWYAGRQNRGR